MEVLLGESYMSLSGPGLYCPHRLKFSSLFYPDSLIKKIWETLSGLGTLWGKARSSLITHAHFFTWPSAAELCCNGSHALSGQASHRSGSWTSPTDLILQVCPGNLHSWLTLSTVTSPTLHPSCPYWGVHPLLFKSLLLTCLVMTLRFQTVTSLLPLLLPYMQQQNCIYHHSRYLCSLPQN